MLMATLLPVQYQVVYNFFQFLMPYGYKLEIRIQWRIQGRGCRRRDPPKGPDSLVLTYIYTKFSKHSRLGSWRPLRGWRTPPREILDPPLELVLFKCIYITLCFEELQYLSIIYLVHTFTYIYIYIFTTNPTSQILTYCICTWYGISMLF